MQKLLTIGVVCGLIWVVLLISNNLLGGWCHAVGAVGGVTLILAFFTWCQENPINKTRQQSKRH